MFWCAAIESCAWTADADLKPSANAEIIDAHGRFLMPGLWDNHQHFSDVDGALDLANGVTSARDMANDTDSFLQRVARFDDGSELGPRVLKAGIIDGTGEFAGPDQDAGRYRRAGDSRRRLVRRPRLCPDQDLFLRQT